MHLRFAPKRSTSSTHFHHVQPPVNSESCFSHAACFAMAGQAASTSTSIFSSTTHNVNQIEAHEKPPSAFIVVDTNFLLSHLTLVQSVQAWHSRYKHCVVLPYIVIEERKSQSRIRLTVVDGLKGSTKKNHGKSIGTLAREAIRWAQEALQSDDHSVIGQARTETVDPDATGDDAILACCLYAPLIKKLISGT